MAMIGRLTSLIPPWWLHVREAFGYMTLDVLDDDDGVVHHDAYGQHEPEQRQVLMEKPNASNTAKLPITDTEPRSGE